MTTRPADALELEYDRTPPGSVGRRGYGLLMALTLLNTALFAGYFIGPKAWYHGKQKWWAQQQAAAQRLRDQQAKAARQAALIQVVADQKQMVVARKTRDEAESARKRGIQQVRQALLEPCRTYAVPPTAVVYEQHPTRAAALLSRARALRWDHYEPTRDPSDVVHPPVRVRPPSAWLALVPHLERGLRPGSQSPKWEGDAEGRSTEDQPHPLLSAGPPAFLHERSAAGGGGARLVAVLLPGPHYHLEWNHALVAVSVPLDVPLEDGPLPVWRGSLVISHDPKIDLDYRVAPAGDPPRIVPRVVAKNMLRVYGGRADPADPSHFTIDLALDERRHTVDGWLEPDGSVLLEPRTGTVQDHDGRRWWRPE